MIETHDNIQSLVGVLTEELGIKYDEEGNLLLGQMVFKQDDSGPSLVVDYLKPEKTYETPEEVLATIPSGDMAITTPICLSAGHQSDCPRKSSWNCQETGSRESRHLHCL